jgi:hypothetical protein
MHNLLRPYLYACKKKKHSTQTSHVSSPQRDEMFPIITLMHNHTLMDWALDLPTIKIC